jgi:hypothetical protein
VRSALVVALVVLSAACARPNSTQAQLPPPTPISTPTPSPSASPTAGHFGFTIQVADNGGGTATVSGNIGIAARLSASLIPACATQCSVELGCVNVCGAFGQSSGGAGPLSYALVSGQLPSGTTLSGLALKGTFTGLSGYLQFAVQVTDSLGATAAVSPTFWIPHRTSAQPWVAALWPSWFRPPLTTTSPITGP